MRFFLKLQYATISRADFLTNLVLLRTTYYSVISILRIMLDGVSLLCTALETTVHFMSRSQKFRSEARKEEERRPSLECLIRKVRAEEEGR